MFQEMKETLLKFVNVQNANSEYANHISLFGSASNYNPQCVDVSQIESICSQVANHSTFFTRIQTGEHERKRTVFRE